MASDRLEEFAPIFYPKSQAVIGSSADEQKSSERFLEALISFGYQGKVYPINSHQGQLHGLKVYSQVAEIPEPVDFATVTAPAPDVPEIVEQCLAKEIKAVQILTAGFSEASEAGRQLEEQLTRTATQGIRIIGPNCSGVYSPSGGLTMLPGQDLPRESGPLAFISQSGDCALQVIRQASQQGIRFSKAVSYGNACDVNESDLLEYLGEDSKTGVVAAYIESVKDCPRFFKLLRQVSAIKPLILWKGEPAQSEATEKKGRRPHWYCRFWRDGHCGNSASLMFRQARELDDPFCSVFRKRDDRADEATDWDTMFQQSGTIRATAIDELIDTILSQLPATPG